jgi:hypothetical protein
MSKHFYAAAVAGLVLAARIQSAAMGALSSGALYIYDDNGIEKYDFASATLSNLVPDTSNPGTFMGLKIGPNGNLFAAAQSPAGQVFQFNSNTGAQIGSGPFVFYEGTPPSPDPHDVNGPEGIAFSPTTGNLAVADVTESNVHQYNSTGANQGSLTSADLDQPTDVTFDSAGNMYVVTGEAEVLKSAGGTGPLSIFVAAESGGLTNPIALTFGPDGKLYVLDASTDNVDRYNSNGSFDEVFATFPELQPEDIAFGPDGDLYVSGDNVFEGTNVVVRVTSTGADDGTLISTSSSSSALMNPRFLAFSTAVPEPGCLGITLLVAPLMMRRRRGK